ncbi:phosphoenolpyruvate mutase [Moorena sp. SIO3H5]|uniref:phosphoenolpyruvate mutase n=1 Tax=Moorena sp. SIO3H5 TaxID=2607834 RepID=UPI0013B87C0A|nr:phosphoenolpyruvate mutase [Moorena sp. SIO3H5]NEO68037.1 phosphoenolpyruvate mutase [Moorena sp. SIO3H5]
MKTTAQLKTTEPRKATQLRKTTQPKKTTQLRTLLNSNQLEFLIEAHDGISAKIAEEAGFQGIWGSGLSISAQLGVRDNNEASWTQVLEVVEFMSDATSVPILLDGDTGYGNFNNVQRLVKKLEQRGVAGVCIEDKLFPKTNSFIKGTAQPLADMDEFCGKIKAAKDAQSDDDFVLIARVEAFIAGWGLSEALRRAQAYYDAGADGILIHSSLHVADEVLAFKREWGDRSPVVIVPTKYYATPTEVFRDAGFSIAIWANHLLRASVTMTQKVAQTLMLEQNLLNVEDKIVPVSEIFRLQGVAEHLEAEQRYLPQNPGAGNRTILLAASRGIELGQFTKDKPKCMVDLHGQPLLSRIVEEHHSVGIQDITVVRGYKKDVVNLPGLDYVDNDDYDTTGELVSLSQGLQELPQDGQDWIIGYGDVLFKKYILQMLLGVDHDFVVIIDSSQHRQTQQIRPDYVACSLPDSTQAFYQHVDLQQISDQLPEGEICGRWTGLLKVSQQGQQKLQDTLNTLLQSEQMRQQGRMPTLINELISHGHRVHVLYIKGHWLDIDQVEDLFKAGSF